MDAIGKRAARSTGPRTPDAVYISHRLLRIASRICDIKERIRPRYVAIGTGAVTVGRKCSNGTDRSAMAVAQQRTLRMPPGGAGAVQPCATRCVGGRSTAKHRCAAQFGRANNSADADCPVVPRTVCVLCARRRDASIFTDGISAAKAGPGDCGRRKRCLRHRYPNASGHLDCR